MKFYKLLFAFLIAIYPPRQVQAKVYPWVDLEPDDIQSIEDPWVEQELRLHLIKTAKTSIDILIFDQRSDPLIALPILSALRDSVLSKKVKLRFGASWFPQFATDFAKIGPKFLMEGLPQNLAEYFIFGGTGLSMKNKSWAMEDGIHQKLLIVDKKWLLATGRGHSDFYLNWIDSAFLIKGNLVSEALASFEETWQEIKSEASPYVPQEGNSSVFRTEAEKNIKNALLNHILSYGQSEEIRRLKNWMNPYARTRQIANFKKKRGRVLHHSFIQQMLSLPEDPVQYSQNERLQILNDVVVSAVSQKISGAKHVAMNTLSLILTPALKETIVESLKKGLKLDIFTNSPTSYQTITFIPLPWPVSLPDIPELTALGAKVSIFRNPPPKNWVYLHRKVLVADDTVFFGSHNYNIPSSIANEEVSFEVEDHDLASKYFKIFENSVLENAEPAVLEKLNEEKTKTNFFRWLFSPFMGFF